MEKKKQIMKWVIIIAIIIIPVMYSFFYLKAFWDPYGNLDDMEIAIVNLDEGDETENLGNDLVEQLKEKDIMKITVLTDQDQAQEGLINQQYYATITIPKNFTKELNQAEGKERKTTTITYSPNQKNNYLASQIINKVVTTVESELRGEVSKKVVASLSDKLQEVPDKLQEIVDGADALHQGTGELEKGLEQVNQGTKQLTTNYSTFDKGIQTAYQGSSELQKGLTQLQQGADKLQAGTSQLEQGTKSLAQVKNGVNELSTGANQIANGVNGYVDGVTTAVTSINSMTSQIQTLGTDLQNYVASHPEVMQDASFQKVMQDLQKINQAKGNAQGLTTLVSKGKELKQGATTLNTGIQSFANQASQLTQVVTGVQTVNQGVNELAQGIAKAQTGSQSLTTGLDTLNTNSKKIQQGIEQLQQGSSQTLTGSQTLLTGTTTFKNEINQGLEDTKEQIINLEGLDEYVANPINIEEIDYGQIKEYGVAFAPYFMSISLWVGALIMLVMVYNDPENRFTLLGKNAKNKYLRTALYMLISVAQGIVLGFLLKLGLGFSVTNLSLYYGTCILISMVFLSIIQFLILNFGDVGKFLCILLLVLQLAASGGTFPIETVPTFFQKIYPIIPMNYTIRLIKESIVKIDTGMIGQNAFVLLGILIFCLVATFLFDYLRTRRKGKESKSS